MTGKTINNYTIERSLGEGGMGNVYLARHNRIDRLVAIKVLHQNLFTNEIIRNRFKNEANALIKLEHPNIVRIYDYVEQDNFACLVMEYIEGYTLDDYIAKVSGPLVTSKALHIISKVLDAVQYAHDNNIYHRDIKPGNIMVSRDGMTVRIMDFGIAKFMDKENFKNTHANTQLGTPFYMAPEQVKGQPYTRLSDIYSLGVTLFEMVTGKCPYQAITNLFELQNKIVNEPLPTTGTYYPHVSAELQQAIVKATEKIPEKRFRSCVEFKSFLISAVSSAIGSSSTDEKAKSKIFSSGSFEKNPGQKLRSTSQNELESISVTKNITPPNLLESYPAGKKKKKTGVFILLLFLVFFVSVAFYLLNGGDPVSKPAADVDNDGVADNIDECPTIAGIALYNGCPKPDSLPQINYDSDGDSVPDSIDRCKDSFGSAALNGCPDNDGDGVANIDDKCPDVVGVLEKQGCPGIENEEPKFHFLRRPQILSDLKREKLTCGEDVFSGKPGQLMVCTIPEDSVQLSNTKMPIVVTLTDKKTSCKTVYQFIYEKAGTEFKYKDKLLYD